MRNNPSPYQEPYQLIQEIVLSVLIININLNIPFPESYTVLENHRKFLSQQAATLQLQPAEGFKYIHPKSARAS